MSKMVDPESVRAMLAEAEVGHKQALVDLTEAQERLQAYASSVMGLKSYLSLIEKSAPRATDKGSLELAGRSDAISTANGHLILPDAYVRPKEAIMRLIAEQPRDWTLAEIVRTMADRKWLDPSLSRPIEAVRAAANRLVDVDHQLVRVGKSSYRRGTTTDLLADIDIGAKA